MIPADLAARLRMLTDASFFDSAPPIQGVAKVREIQARLPQLLPGQTFTANIQRALPDGTFQAAVAGRSYTLALNHAAKPGDTLELVVSRTTAQTVFAQVLDPAVTSSTPRSQFSPTGQLISFMLTGQPAPKPALLAEGKPLLPAPPTPGVAALPLASALRQALGQSGLFYESHQQQWLAGKLDLAALGREPQAQLGNQRTAAAVGQNMPAAAASSAAPSPEAKPAAGQLAAKADEAALVAREASAARPLNIPDRVLPIVHQQLEGLATQQYPLHGQAWPGQSFELIVHERGGDGTQADNSGDKPDWQTTLRVIMPVLGEVQAQLTLNTGGVSIRLAAPDDATRERLDTGHTRLANSLEAAGLHLAGFIVERAEPEAAESEDILPDSDPDSGEG